MSNVVQEKVVIEANSAGLDKVVTQIDAISAKLQAQGVKVPKWFAEAAASQAKSIAVLSKALEPALKAQEMQQKRFAALTRQADGVMKKYDTAYANAAKYAAEEAKINRIVEGGALAREKANKFLGMAAERYGIMGKEALAANQNVRLTANQMQGLGYQINDIGTMLALGASPFQIMASQAGQVVQVLSDGPSGLKGSLSAIGSGIAGFARMIPASGYAIAGVTAAVGALWYATSGPEARTAEESLKTYEDAVKRLRDPWKDAADAAEDYFKRAQGQGRTKSAAYLDLGEDLRQLRLDFKAAVNDLDTSDALGGRILRPFAGHVSEARKEISEVYTELRMGQTTAKAAAQAMERIRLDPKADVYARNFAEQIRRALPPIIEMEEHLQALNNAAAQLAAPKSATRRLDVTDKLAKGRFGDADPMDDIRDGLKKQREELEATTKETDSFAKASADMRRAIAGSVEGLQIQIDTFGQSEGAQAALRMQTDLLADAERSAAEAKQKIDPSLVEYIKAQSSEYGRLTDRLNALGEAEAKRKRLAEFDQDLRFRVDQSGRGELDQRIAARMGDVGITFDEDENL